MFVRKRCEHFDGLKIRVVEVARFESAALGIVAGVELGTGHRLARTTVFARQHPTGQRGVGDHCDIVLGRDGDHLSTETGLQNVEYALYRLVPEQVLDIGDPKRFRKHPGRKVRYTGIDDFSLVDQVVDGP